MAKTRTNRKNCSVRQDVEAVRTDARIWKCVCPRCGTTFEREMFWTGNGLPRTFCDPCRRSEDYEYWVDDYCITVDTRHPMLNRF